MDCPKSLFKYRRFDKYTIDMLKTGYIYFCPANRLDDQFECSIGISKNILNGDIDAEIKNMIPFIKNQISPYSNNKIENIDILNYFKNGKLNENAFRNLCNKYSPETSNIDINDAIKTINTFDNLYELDKDNLEEAFKILYTMQEKIGICSLAELNNNQPMWTMYADNYNGYCIEYDFEKFIKENPNYKDELFKVIYSNSRKNNIIKIIIEIAFSQLFNKLKLTNKNIDIKERIINIMCTKSIDWSYQNEWRIFSTPNNKSLKLPIKSVYLGKDIKKKNKQIICNIAKKCRFDVYLQYDDFEQTKLCFKKIEV